MTLKEETASERCHWAGCTNAITIRLSSDGSPDETVALCDRHWREAVHRLERAALKANPRRKKP